MRSAEVVVESRGRGRWSRLTGVALVWIAFTAGCGFTRWIWNGSTVNGHSFEHWLQVVEGDGPNQETARDQLWLKLRRGVCALRADEAERELSLLRDELR